jgi:hypothetical protein
MFLYSKDRSNCLIEAAKGGHTEIVKLLLEYPKSVTQRTQMVSSVEPLHHNLSNENDEEGEEEETLPNSFPLSSGLVGDKKKSSQPSQFLKNLQKIVPENLLDVLQTGVHDIKGILLFIISIEFPISPRLDNSWSNNDRLSTPTDEISSQTSEINHTQQTRKLQILGKMNF